MDSPSTPRSLQVAKRIRGRGLLVALALGSVSTSAAAQWSRTYDSAYLPGSFNWQFRQTYPTADRLFNAFDYGHAILYETLWAKPRAEPSQLENREYDFITKRLLANPPRLPLDERAIEPDFAKLAPEAKAMLDWAHVLHRQVYDVWADPSIALADKDARIIELLRYYRTRRDIAFSGQPKSMNIMDGQLYSLAFRQKYPKFNGLIWAYHWLQIGLYEPLMTGKTEAERQSLVDATVSRFRQMLDSPPTTMPYLMPMTPAIAPTFAHRYPDVGAIFDNLHMMHDVVADILTSPEIPRSAKRKEILEAAALFRSDTAFAIPFDEWLQMAQTMGVNNMGGPAVDFGATLPQPTVARGMSMAGMAHAAMAGMPGMQHGTMPAGQAVRSGSGMSMPGMNMPGMASGKGGMTMSDTTQSHGEMSLAVLMAMHERMMADPVIRERVATDPVLQRMMRELSGQMGGGQSSPMNMSGMQMPSRGRNMTGMSGMGMDSSASAAERRQAVEFIVRLFSDPAVESRIHSDPELHKLWTDPDVQRRLTEIRRSRASQPDTTARPDRATAPPAPPAPPAPAAPVPHKHP